MNNFIESARVITSVSPYFDNKDGTASAAHREEGGVRKSLRDTN